MRSARLAKEISIATMRQALRSLSIPAADHKDCCDNRSLVAGQGLTNAASPLHVEPDPPTTIFSFSF
jgi:hypothetical protein